jgi:hypothetical protein
MIRRSSPRAMPVHAGRPGRGELREERLVERQGASRPHASRSALTGAKRARCSAGSRSSRYPLASSTAPTWARPCDERRLARRRSLALRRAPRAAAGNSTTCVPTSLVRISHASRLAIRPRAVDRRTRSRARGPRAPCRAIAPGACRSNTSPRAAPRSTASARRSWPDRPRRRAAATPVVAANTSKNPTRRQRRRRRPPRSPTAAHTARDDLLDVALERADAPRRGDTTRADETPRCGGRRARRRRNTCDELEDRPAPAAQQALHRQLGAGREEALSTRGDRLDVRLDRRGLGRRTGVLTSRSPGAVQDWSRTAAIAASQTSTRRGRTAAQRLARSATLKSSRARRNHPCGCRP